MKKILIITVLAGLLVFPALSQNPPLDKNWEAVFEDNFNTLNTARWEVKDHFDDFGGGYPLYLKENTYIVNNERLVFETKKMPTNNPYCCPPQHVDQWGCKRQWLTGECYQYTSGCIYSQVPYKYGYFEVYAKLPGGDGYYPTFWMHGSGTDIANNNCWYNEIDIFEIYPCRQNSIDIAPHWWFSCPNDDELARYTQAACNFPYTYHWYGLEWDKDKITWYIDRKSVRQEANNMEGIGIQNAMYIILSVSLHSPNDDCPITNNSIFPNYMYIEQANVWRLRCDNVPVIEIPDFTQYQYGVKKSISLSGATIIPVDSNISLRATDYIELKNGFEVPLGAEFYVDINPCDNAARVKKQN